MAATAVGRSTQIILQSLFTLEPLLHSFKVAFVLRPNESAHEAFDEQWKEMEKSKVKMNVATVEVNCLSHGPKELHKCEPCWSEQSFIHCHPCHVGDDGSCVRFVSGRRRSCSAMSHDSCVLGIDAGAAQTTLRGGMDGPCHVMNAPVVGLVLDLLGGRLSRRGSSLLPSFVADLLATVTIALLVFGLGIDLGLASPFSIDLLPSR